MKPLLVMDRIAGLRRPILVVLAALVLTAGSASAQDAQTTGNFDKGVEFYQAGRYADAALEFGRVAAAGRESAAVYFNLANSWIRAGEIGKAAWALERAFIMDPRDEDIRFNRALVRTALGDPPQPDTGILEPVRRLLDHVRTTEIELATQLMTILLVLWMLGFTYLRSWRPFFGTVFWITLMAASLVWGAAWMRWSEIRYPAAVVQQKEVFVRYGPTESDSKARQLKAGALLRIEKRSGDWYLVRLANGQAGWIPESSVLRVYP